jgi:non-ribosomal peptide synthase protein (TIGR01720 family)
MRSYVLEIVGLVVNGQPQVDWTYSENIHLKSTVDSLAKTYLEHLTAIIDHCLLASKSSYKPADFSEVDLTEDELKDFLTGLGEAGDGSGL